MSTKLHPSPGDLESTYVRHEHEEFHALARKWRARLQDQPTSTPNGGEAPTIHLTTRK